MGEPVETQEEMIKMGEMKEAQEELITMEETEAAEKELLTMAETEEAEEVLVNMRETEEAEEELIKIGETQSAKEELIKQDLSAVPLLIILSPPPNFLPAPGQPSMSWHKWLKSFENYIEQMGESKLVDSTKCLLLQNCLGREGQRIFTTLMPGETSYTDAISALTTYFSSDQASQMHLLNFHQRTQMDGETTGQFLCALDKLLKPSNYQELYEQLILKQLVEKTNNPQLRERLLSEPAPLTLAKALQISEEVESLAKCDSSVPEVNVFIGDDAEPPVKRKRGRPRKGETIAKKTPPTKKTPPKKTTPAKKTPANKTPKTTPSTSKDDYYYDSDKLYYSDDGVSSHNSSPTCNTVILKEIKIEEQSSEDEFLAPSKGKGPCCPICENRQFRGINKLLRHMRTHTQEKPFTCPICGVSFSQTYHMTRHMRNQHGAGQHVCSLCGITLSSATELQDHKKTHPAQAVPCPLCNEMCPNPRALTTHIKSHSKKTLSQADTGQPALRKKGGKPKRAETKRPNSTESATDSRIEDVMNQDVTQSDSQGDLAKFNNSIAADNSHQNFIDYISQEGNVASHDEFAEQILSELRTEESDDENEDLVQTNLKRPHCPICTNTFMNLTKLLRHMQTHATQKPYSCGQCGMAFSQGYHMARHMRTQHGAGQFVCPKCGLDLASMGELQRHKSTHPPQPVPCPYCENISPNYHKFLGHIRRHGKLSQSEEQASEIGKPLSDDSDDMSEEQEPLGDCELLGQGVSMGVGGDVAAPVKMEENVAPPVQKRKRGRPRRDEARATAHPDISQTSRNKLHYNDARVGAEDTDRCESKCNTQMALSSNLSDIEEGMSQMKGQNDEAMLQEAAESETEFCPESDGSGDSADDSNVKRKKSKLDVNKANQNDNKQGQSSAPKSKGHFCPYCVGRRFRGANKLARHMRTHTKEKPFKCPVCDKAFSQSYHMTRHQRMQHGQGMYICSQCGQNLPTWTDFKAHKSLHSPGLLCCPFCDKQFKHRSVYMSHIRIHKNGPKRVPSVPKVLKCYPCADCGRIFKRKSHLKRHILGHRKATNGEYYTCSTCQKIFAFPEDLKRHMNKHEKESNGICSLCSESFNSLEELQAHVEETHNKTYPCKTCGKKFKLEHALKKHEEGHLNGQYYCAVCCKFFQKQSHYKRHMLVHRRRECRCPHCNTVFLKMNAFKYHLRSHTSERPYQCSCCLESYEHKEDFDQHCLKHKKFKKEKPYSCTRCEWAFATLAELSDHMSTHDGEQPANCAICGRTFLNKTKLEKHMSIHTGERPHLCSICGNGFPSAASLKLHVNIHTGFKPFQCDQCPKSFSTGSSLKLHSRQHMAVRPTFECPECGRTYGRMTELRMHQRYHTGDKPHACTCCNKRFISRDKLNVHMRIHTGERPYSCDHCGQTFSQAGDRNRHMKKYH